MNQFWKELIDLFIVCALRILDGKIREDLQGNFTYYSYNGSSTVGLIFVSEYIIRNTIAVQYLSLGDLGCPSDHKTIILKVMSTLHSKSNQKNYFRTKV